MKRACAPINTRQAGFSLVEVMVAMVIGLVMLLGVTQIFLTASRSGVTSSDLSRVQESGRIALELISKELRRAGYKGCGSSSSALTTDGITYPDEAIGAGAGAGEITVNYARLDAAGNFPARDCNNQRLAAHQVRFSNCATALCIESSDSGGEQQLTANTQMAVSYGWLRVNNIVWGVPATTAEWADVQVVKVALTVTNPSGDVSRTFSSTIDLRNRL
jgi:prepilin-type N-terminal cleavage/methylation domain-containing protein